MKPWVAPLFVRLGPVVALFALLASPLRVAAQGSCVELAGHTAAVRCLAFSPDAGVLVSGGLDGTVRWWHIPSGREIKSARPGGDSVEAVGFTRLGRQVVACGSARTVVYSYPDGRVVRSRALPVHAPGGCALSPDATRLAQADTETVTVRNLANGRVTNWLDLRREPGGKQLKCLAYSPDGHWLLAGGSHWDAAGGANHSMFWMLHLWTRKLYRQQPPSGIALEAAAWGGDRAVVGGLQHPYGSHQGWVNVFRAGRSTTLATTEMAVTCLAVDAEGTRAAVGAGELKVWDLVAGTGGDALSSRPSALAFGPPGSRLLAAGFDDGRVRVWHLSH